MSIIAILHKRDISAAPAHVSELETLCDPHTVHVIKREYHLRHVRHALLILVPFVITFLGVLLLN